MSRWFRMYDEVLDDPKVQRLPAPLFKAWVNLLCLASRHGGTLPPIGDIAFALRVDDEQAETMMADLCERGLIDTDRPHNWDARQFVSDNSTERVKRFREKKAEAAKPVSCNADETFHATPPDTETEADTETEKKVRARETRLTPSAPGFDVFWSAYPVRKGRGAALKAWAKAILRAPPEEIIAAAARYRPAETKFTKHPATWLNQDCWTDEPDHHDEPSDPFLDAMRKEVADRQRWMEGRRGDDMDATAPDQSDGTGGGGRSLPRLAFVAGACRSHGGDEGPDPRQDSPEQAPREVGSRMAGGYP